jgi:hypothetical protein
MDPEILKSIVGPAATIVSALIVGVAGGLISRSYSRERDRQDRESQWRQHAIELTKLELERKRQSHSDDASRQLRPSILDFLANYRDLQELGGRTPAELYKDISESRIVKERP